MCAAGNTSGGVHQLTRMNDKESDAMSKKKESRSRETLVGVITPVNWEGEAVTEVALCATDDEEYHIENSHKFLDLLQECIEATGDVHRSKKSFRSINIKKYRVV